jgi:hypothetical protein
MQLISSNTVFHPPLCDKVNEDKFITKQQADEIFDFFRQNSLFRWKDGNNDCEDRANAICILLDEWKIYNFKGWAFSGYYLKREMGSLINGWNYHVAALLPVREDNQPKYYMVDPATSDTLITLEQWASHITNTPFSYHFFKEGFYYIFQSQRIRKDKWYKRNKRNYNWTMQGLSGINGMSSVGKAQLSFKKQRVKNTERAFNNLKHNKPQFNW